MKNKTAHSCKKRNPIDNISLKIQNILYNTLLFSYLSWLRFGCVLVAFVGKKAPRLRTKKKTQPFGKVAYPAQPDKQLIFNIL